MSGFSLFNDFPFDLPPPPSNPVEEHTDVELIQVDAPASNTGKRHLDDDNSTDGFISAQKTKNISKSSFSSKDAEPKDKKLKIPPFFLEPIKHWNNLLLILNQAAQSMCSKMNKNWIRLSVETENRLS